MTPEFPKSFWLVANPISLCKVGQQSNKDGGISGRVSTQDDTEVDAKYPRTYPATKSNRSCRETSATVVIATMKTNTKPPTIPAITSRLRLHRKRTKTGMRRIEIATAANNPFFNILMRHCDKWTICGLSVLSSSCLLFRNILKLG